MTAPTDSSLIEATRSGDNAAFGVLVERYQKPIYNAAFRITGNREDALEAAQTAFMKAFDKLSSFDRSRRFFSWIFRIVVNESLDITKRQRRFVDDDPHESALIARENPESDVGASLEGERVHQALKRLTPEQRTVIVLRHFQDFSYSEVAEIVGIPEKTVKSRLFSARRELRHILSANETVAD